jgi:hypothetical protein
MTATRHARLGEAAPIAHRLGRWWLRVSFSTEAEAAPNVSPPTKNTTTSLPEALVTAHNDPDSSCGARVPFGCELCHPSRKDEPISESVARGLVPAREFSMLFTSKHVWRRSRLLLDWTATARG